MSRISPLVASLAAGASLFIASPAFAYPDPQLGNLTGSAADGIVSPGERFTLAGDFGGVDCDPSTATFEGATRTGSGSTFDVAFTAPDEAGQYTLRITCAYDDGTTKPASARVARGGDEVVQASYDPTQAATDLPSIAKTSSFPFAITVRADVAKQAEANAGSALPDTGGPDLTWFVVGGVLVLGGAAVVARRRTAA